MNFRKRLPSLTALLALEAAVRHRSFTEAAKELGVTQAAVSRLIAQLEEEFGTRLFTRGHRMIEPTPSCQILGSVLAEAFSNIADSVDSTRSSTTDVVTIGATIAFSSFWLLPRLAEFRQRHPGVHIRVVSQDSRYDLAGGEVDIVVRYGVPPFSDGIVVASRGDRLFPVCSPEYARRHDLTAFPAGDVELIDTDVADRSWYRWADWFARLGQRSLAIRAAFRFSHYTETIYATKASQGVALGWSTLIETFLQDGSLVKVGDTEIAVEEQYNIVIPLHAKRTAACQPVIAWLAEALQRP